MTSLAFILGVVPLVTATGAGATARISLGTCVLSGMIASTCLAVLFVPSFFVVLQRLEERLKGRRPEPEDSSPILDCRLTKRDEFVSRAPLAHNEERDYRNCAASECLATARIAIYADILQVRRKRINSARSIVRDGRYRRNRVTAPRAGEAA